ncbi:LacI family transcriptional regulator [Herbiconiux moechotypicola]|uniref:LacI family DNA-binding transcriptional regulator n=1 Tax=Herbiconiux moechotypicola TaxID=637393 RepID=A0ABN3D7Q0_9MICO|nr:LacI family DNA-binding transcriptional regulator [Herbiconiux moechotypicola]MCS5728372.1 LacI family transcriptional regulator [Herbiconiux moechotypicola]
MPDSRPVTLLDVARAAGVGKSTVSNVLSGTGRFSDETRREVLEAAARLGYQPNRAARRLRGGRTGVVGVHVPGVPSTSEFYMRFVFGAMEYLSSRGRDTAILGGHERAAFPAVDGVVVADPHADDPTAVALLASDVPSVSFERPYGAAMPRPDVVVRCDHDRALRWVLDHLRHEGSRWPAMMLPPETGDWAVQLGAAYRSWCRENRVEPVVVPISWIPSPAEIESATAVLLRQHPGVDGLFCAPVDTAPATLAVLAAEGRRVGEDFLLATGTESATAALVQPPITSIDLDPLTAGSRCAELLDAVLEGAERGEVEHPITLRLRSSTRGSGTFTVHGGRVRPRPVPPPR